jgi:hypothetical protein
MYIYVYMVCFRTWHHIIQIHLYICTYIYICTNTCTYICTNNCMYTYEYLCTNTYIYTYMYKYLYIYIYIHTRKDLPCHQTAWNFWQRCCNVYLFVKSGQVAVVVRAKWCSKMKSTTPPPPPCTAEYQMNIHTTHIIWMYTQHIYACTSVFMIFIHTPKWSPHIFHFGVDIHIICTYMHVYTRRGMWWLRLVGSLKL